MTTIGESISRVRNIIKAVTMDAFVTDRVIYSLIQKYAKMYIKRQDGIATRAKFGTTDLVYCRIQGYHILC